jgi:hypothetical protein
VSRTTSGELLGRDGRLIFQPVLDLKGKRARTEGGLFFIWDTTKNSGYVLSEALQGFAPIKIDAPPAGQFAIAREAIKEDINGHPCHQCKATAVLGNGLQEHLTLWQADDAKHFPVRIEADNGAERMTLNFSEIRLEYPPLGLFAPPQGFTAYANSVALMNELIIREASLSKKYQITGEEEPVPVNSSTWQHESGAGAGMHP